MVKNYAQVYEREQNEYHPTRTQDTSEPDA